MFTPTLCLYVSIFTELKHVCRIKYKFYSRLGDIVPWVWSLKNKFLRLWETSRCGDKQVRATSLTFLYAVVSCKKRLRFAAVLIRLNARQTLSSRAALRHGLARSCASPSSRHGSREGVVHGKGKPADRLRLTFIRSSWSTSREQQPSVTRSRCHRLSASERPSSIMGAVRVRKGRHHARAVGFAAYINTPTQASLDV